MLGVPRARARSVTVNLLKMVLQPSLTEHAFAVSVTARSCLCRSAPRHLVHSGMVWELFRCWCLLGVGP